LKRRREYFSGCGYFNWRLRILRCHGNHEAGK